MSHSQIPRQAGDLRHAWLNLLDKHTIPAGSTGFFSFFQAAPYSRSENGGGVGTRYLGDFHSAASSWVIQGERGLAFRKNPSCEKDCCLSIRQT